MSAPDDRDYPRLRSAWRTWLSALAVDAEAAVAAALAYEALAAEGRDAWLDALDEDRDKLDVPAVALYAPLLAVEPDETRRARIARALAKEERTPPARDAVRALLGQAPSGEHVCVLVSPLYLDFVALLVCRYRPDRGFISARRDPVRHVIDAIGRRFDGGDETGLPLSCTVDGVAVVESPLSVVVEELAHAIVADRREGRPAPEVLGSYVHLFAPDIVSAGSGPASPRPSPPPAGP